LAALDVLLRYRWFQEHIDLPIPLPGQTPAEGCFTTALHTAVSQQNIPHIFLLLTQRTEWLPKDPHVAACHAANPDQKSANGATPLHIAVHSGNPILVRILLAFSADTEFVNKDGLTAVELAKKLATQGAAKVTKERIRIVEILENPGNENPSDLMGEMAPVLIPPIMAPTVNGDDDESGEEEEEKKKKKEVSAVIESVKKKKKTNETKLGKVLKEIQALQKSVRGIEQQMWTMKMGGSCAECSAAASKCPQCHTFYCGVCNEKSGHKCTQNE
jgi:Fe2+ or Zn2+ uptake regulation protein